MFQWLYIWTMFRRFVLSTTTNGSRASKRKQKFALMKNLASFVCTNFVDGIDNVSINEWRLNDDSGVCFEKDEKIIKHFEGKGLIVEIRENPYKIHNPEITHCLYLKGKANEIQEKGGKVLSNFFGNMCFSEDGRFFVNTQYDEQRKLSNLEGETEESRTARYWEMYSEVLEKLKEKGIRFNINSYQISVPRYS